MILTGQVIRMVRNARRMTMRELASRAQLSIGCISEIENGNMKLSENVHAKIANVFTQIGVIPEEIECTKKLLEVSR